MFIPPAAAPALTTNPIGWVVLAGMTALTILPQLFKRDVDEDNAIATLNQIEAALWEAQSQYFSMPASFSNQKALLQKFDEAYAWLTGPGIGSNRAIEDANWRRNAVRDRSRGGKYDWFSSIRDPVAEDPRLQGISGGVEGVIGEAAMSLGLSSGQLLALIVAGAIGLWLLLKKGKI
jgi:hypothetical protein